MSRGKVQVCRLTGGAHLHRYVAEGLGLGVDQDFGFPQKALGWPLFAQPAQSHQQGQIHFKNSATVLFILYFQPNCCTIKAALQSTSSRNPYF